jgi:hypothetical protein
MMHGESLTQIKNDILFKEGIQNVVRNVLKRIEKLFSITAYIWSIYIKNVKHCIFCIFLKHSKREFCAEFYYHF